MALYVDWKNVYVTKREPTVEEQLAGELPLTQFGRACQKLGIEIITASSPQAKGRVERKHGVYQDRFFQIGLQPNLPLARRRVMVQEHLDGSIHMVYRDRDVLFTEIKELPRKPIVTQQKATKL